MNPLIDIKKPLFEYSDVELKAIAFDETQMIKLHEKNVVMILSELERRALSNVMTQTNSMSALLNK
jgi:hypothetical protein